MCEKKEGSLGTFALHSFWRRHDDFFVFILVGGFGGLDKDGTGWTLRQTGLKMLTDRQAQGLAVTGQGLGLHFVHGLRLLLHSSPGFIGRTCFFSVLPLAPALLPTCLPCCMHADIVAAPTTPLLYLLTFQHSPCLAFLPPLHVCCSLCPLPSFPNLPPPKAVCVCQPFCLSPRHHLPPPTPAPTAVTPSSWCVYL